MELLFASQINKEGGRVMLRGNLRRLLKMLEKPELKQARGDGLKIRVLFCDFVGMPQQYEVLFKNYFRDSRWNGRERANQLTGRGLQRLVADQRLKPGNFVRLWVSRANASVHGGGGDRGSGGVESLILFMTVERREERAEHGRKEREEETLVDQLAADLASRLRPAEENVWEEQLAADFSQLSIPGDAGVVKNN